MEEIGIRCVTVGMLGTCCYILTCPDRDDCVVIDPGADADRIRRAMGDRRPAAILLTHGHFDHIGAVDALMEEGTVLAVHEDDAEMLGETALNMSWMVGLQTTAQKANRLLREGDVIEAAGMAFTVLHTPGHTPGSVCYAIGDVLFTGDTILGRSHGRTDLPGGSDAQMAESLRRLSPLRAGRTLLGGHGG